MSEIEQQPSGNLSAPCDDEGAMKSQNLPCKQEEAIRIIRLIVDVMNSTRDFKEANFCKRLLIDCSRKYHLNLDELIELVEAHARDLDEFDKFMKAKKGEQISKRLSEQDFAHAIDQLMEALDDGGHYIFKIQRHWIAVFRVAADMQLIGENDYLGFCKWIKKIHPASFRVKVTQGDLKQISNSDCYMKPYEKWKFVPMGNVKKKPYDAMVNVVDCLKKLLEKEGKVA